MRVAADIEPWKVHLETSRESLLSQIQTVDDDPLKPVTSQFGVSGLTTLRHLGKDFADAIEAWPTLCGAAREFSV